MKDRFHIVSESHGLVATAEAQDEADLKAIITLVQTANTVYVVDRLTQN